MALDSIVSRALYGTVVTFWGVALEFSNTMTYLSKLEEFAKTPYGRQRWGDLKQADLDHYYFDLLPERGVKVGKIKTGYMYDLYCNSTVRKYVGLGEIKKPSSVKGFFKSFGRAPKGYALVLAGLTLAIGVCQREGVQSLVDAAGVGLFYTAGGYTGRTLALHRYFRNRNSQ